jgi:hypothetical protein
MPPRPTAADYPKGVPLDERGNISRTIEGRPLTAQVVAGRSALGGSGVYPDRGIDPQTVKRLGTEAGGASFLELSPRSLNGDVGKFIGSRDPATGERKSVITTRNDLSPEGAENVRAHEVAHLFDWISGKLPVPSKGPVRNEMEQVYHRLSTNKTPEPGWESKYGLKTPEAFGYHGEKANKELAAESIRAYMTDPNYIKTVAPRAAALIRKHFNDHPYLSKFIQFNTAALALLGSSGLYSSGGMVGGQDPTHPDITKASGGMIDDPAKAIRRAVLVAKGLSRTIGPMPSKDEGERVHPASMVPGVHVQALAGGGEVQPTDETGFDAWHGTPHKFEPEPGAPLGRFRSEKIGTGEGAQAFGHGLYLGEEGTARGYRDRLKGGPGGATIFQTISQHYNNEKFIPISASDAVRPFVGKGPEAIKNALIQQAKKMQKSSLDSQRDNAKKIEEFAADNDLHKKLDELGGHIYHVRVNANPEHFLDWDKPLSEQRHVLDRIDHHIGDPEIVMQRLFADPSKATGKDLHDAFGGKHKPEAVATKLQEMGIPGIRYLDANSRGPTGNPTHNHVIFDPSIIDIKRRYKRGGEVERHGYKTDGAVTGSGGMQGYKDVPFQHIEERSPGWGATWTPLHEVGSKLGNPTKISESAANYGDFMNMMAHKASSQGLSPRDLVKSYLMTVSSQGRSAVAPHTILKNWPEYPGPTHQNIRPEGAMGEWLNSPMGKRYLDNAEQGKIDQGAIDHALNAFQGFGKINTAEGAALPWAVHSLVPHTKIVSDMIADSVKGRHSAEDWRNWVKQNIKNVAFAKSGFWASMLGRGDQAVPDARQMLLNTPNSNADAIKLIGTGNSDPAILREGEAMRRIMDRQRALNLAVPKELEPHYHALAHHTIWDASEGTDTTHQDVINAMRHAASGGAINENDRTHPVAMIFKAMGMPGLDGHRGNYNRGGSKNAYLSPDDALIQKALQAIEQKKLAPFTRSGADIMEKDPSFAVRQQVMGKTFKKTPEIPLNEMESTHISKESLAPQKIISPEDIFKQRGAVVGLLGDRTPAGTLLTHVGGIPLTKPVNQQGGGDYARSEFAEGNQPAAWGNRLGTARTMLAKMKGSTPEGTPLYGAHTLMGLGSADSSHHVYQTILRMIPNMEIHPKHIAAFDEEMRRLFPAKGKKPDWPGVTNTEAAEKFFASRPGSDASAFAKYMNAGRWKSAGFPDIGAVRFANTEPRLLNAPNLSSGYALSAIDLNGNIIKTPKHVHETYPAQIPSAGGYAGGFEAPVPAKLMFPEAYSKFPLKTSKGAPIDYDSPGGTTLAQQSLMTKVPVQMADQQWLDNIMPHLESTKEKWGYKTGGDVIDHALSVVRHYTPRRR